MSKFLNTNTLHNVMNIVIALLAAFTAFLLATGCTTLATGALECSKSWVNPTYTTAALAVLGGIKTLVNIWRDGLSGLIKPQPPVQK
jgi:uncharacterized membrane protein